MWLKDVLLLTLSTSVDIVPCLLVQNESMLTAIYWRKSTSYNPTSIKPNYPFNVLSIYETCLFPFMIGQNCSPVKN